MTLPVKDKKEVFKMDKMKKTAKGLDVFFKILQGFALAGIIVTLILNAVGLAVGYDRIVDTGDMNVTVNAGGLLIRAEDMVFEVMEVRRAVLLLSAVMLVSLITAWIGLRLVRQILEPMKEGEPFRSGTADRIKRMGWFVIASGLLVNVFEAAVKGMLARAIIASSAEGPVIYGVEHRMDLGFIVTAFIIFLFSYIFRYGEELQRLSDETL